MDEISWLIAEILSTQTAVTPKSIERYMAPYNTSVAAGPKKYSSPISGLRVICCEKEKIESESKQAIRINFFILHRI
jgi:hypothetical protein